MARRCWASSSPHRRDLLRNQTFGFIFQFYHLLPELSLQENVLAPLMIRHSAWEFWKRRREFRRGTLAKPSCCSRPLGVERRSRIEGHCRSRKSSCSRRNWAMLVS